MKLKPSIKPGKSRRGVAAPAAPANIPFKTILATTDFSDASRAGVRYAVTLAEKLDAGVTVLHVVEPPSRFAGLEGVVLAREDSEVAVSARVQMETFAEREIKGDLRLTSCVRTGKPFHEITTAARERAADLIVIATHGSTGMERILLGSTAERVVRHAPCPVLTVPARELPKRASKKPAVQLKKILVPIDFSEISKDALPYAAFLTEHFGAEIILLHVVETFPIDYLSDRELRKQTIVPMMKQAEAGLKRMATNLSKSTGVNTSVIVRHGTPFHEICHAAKTLDTGLIVLTTHGYTGLKHIWLGSTAERVVRHAPCPVLAVRERDQKFGNAANVYWFNKKRPERAIKPRAVRTNFD